MWNYYWLRITRQHMIKWIELNLFFPPFFIPYIWTVFSNMYLHSVNKIMKTILLFGPPFINCAPYLTALSSSTFRPRSWLTSFAKLLQYSVSIASENLISQNQKISDQNASMFGSNSSTTSLQQSRQHKAEGRLVAFKSETSVYIPLGLVWLTTHI